MLLRNGLGTPAQCKQPVEHHGRRSHLRAGVFLELRLLAPAEELRADLEALCKATASSCGSISAGERASGEVGPTHGRTWEVTAHRRRYARNGLRCDSSQLHLTVGSLHNVCGGAIPARWKAARARFLSGRDPGRPL